MTMKKENWIVLTNKEIYASVKILIILERIRLDCIDLGMYREWKKIEFPNAYYIWIWEQQDWEVDQEIDGRIRREKMEE